jgi:hypothetical protein
VTIQAHPTLYKVSEEHFSCETNLTIHNKNKYFTIVQCKSVLCLIPGSAKAKGREPKSCLGQVFNYKLGINVPVH